MTELPTVYLFDSRESHANLLPLSFTRPIADFRIGITTIREKWEQMMPADYRYLPVEYLREKFGKTPPSGETALFISGALIPDTTIINEILNLKEGEAIADPDSEEKGPVAYFGTIAGLTGRLYTFTNSTATPRIIRFSYDIFLLNPSIIAEDFRRITAGRKSQPIHPSNTIIGDTTDKDGNPTIFIEEGASMVGATINLLNGPVYLGAGSEIMEGACVRGPLALCENAKIKMGAKIYGGCTFGPYCKIGGEVDNSVFFGFSNKAHDGYVGNAVIGEWCNLGAGVNASNLKNDYSRIRLWNYRTHTFMRTDLQFCGPIIGDHTKIGVNCMLNTATVLGVGVNIHGAGFPRVFVPSFSEGSSATGFTNVSITKFMQIAERVLSRRGRTITDMDREIYERVYEVASSFKN